MDGRAGPLSSNSVISPGWESGLQVGDEESTGAEGERGLVAMGGCLSQEDHHDSLFWSRVEGQSYGFDHELRSAASWY